VLAIIAPVLAFLLVVGLLFFGVRKLVGRFRRQPPATSTPARAT
jgi:hypothetical protein